MNHHRHINESAFQIRDIPQAILMVIRKSVVNLVSIRMHLMLSATWADLRRRVMGIPAQVQENLKSAFSNSLNESAIKAVGIEHTKYSSCLHLHRMLPLHPGFGAYEWLISGLDQLDDALGKKRGVILATAHLGFPHLIPRILQLRGYRIYQVVAADGRLKRKQEEDRRLARGSKFWRYVNERTRVVTPVIEPHDIIADLDVRPILRVLADNGIVMIAGDGMRSAQFIQLQLLGRPYPFPTGFIKLAILTGAPVLPAFCIFDAGGAISIEISKPLPLDSEGQMEDNLQLFASALDGQLRQTPHLWGRWGRANWFEEVVRLTSRELKERYRMDGVSGAIPSNT